MTNSHSQLESSIDSSANLSGLKSIVPVIPSPTKKIMKIKHDNRKPPSSSTKAALRNFSLKRRVGIGVEKTLFSAECDMST